MNSKFIFIIYVIIQLFRGYSTQSIDGNNDTNTESVNNTINDYVVRLNFHLKEETLPEFIGDMLNATDINIIVDDIIQLGKIDQLTLEQTNAIINYYNLTTSQVFNVDNLEEILKFTGTSFSTFYDNLVKSLQISGQTLGATLNHLNINTVKFFEALGLNLNDIYDILRNGTYDQTNIDNVLLTIDKKADQVFNTVRTIILFELTHLNRTYFIDKLNNYGLNRRKFIELWSILNVTTQDVYRVENFKIILDNILINLNKSILPGIIINGDRLVVHRKLYEIFKSIDYINKFRIDANRLEIEQFCKYINQNIVEFKLKQTTDAFIQRTNEIVDNNCSYIRIDGDMLIIDDLLFVFNSTTSKIIANKNSNTTFQLGAPLICSNHQLYGLATEDNPNSIIFDTFVESSTTTDSTTINNGSSKIELFSPIIIIIIVQILFKLF